MGDGRAEPPATIGDAGQAAIPLRPDVDGRHVRILESSQLEGSYVADVLQLVHSSYHHVETLKAFFLLTFMTIQASDSPCKSGSPISVFSVASCFSQNLLISLLWPPLLCSSSAFTFSWVDLI